MTVTLADLAAFFAVCLVAQALLGFVRRWLSRKSFSVYWLRMFR
jgi:hypothetical protein